MNILTSIVLDNILDVYLSLFKTRFSIPAKFEDTVMVYRTL